MTIIPSDKMVGINNNFIGGLDLASCEIPTNVHALQWYETFGEIEFILGENREKPQNEIITELPTWALAAESVYLQIKKEIEEAQAREIEERLAKRIQSTVVQ
jgi:hypothetical protein